MIREFVLECSACLSKVAINAARFDHFVSSPLACTCGDPPGPSQKMFWVAQRLDRTWRDMPKNGFLPAAVPDIVDVIGSPKLRYLPFRMKQSTVMMQLWPRWKVDPLSSAPAEPAVYHCRSGEHELLREWRQDSPISIAALEQVAYWMMRLNLEMAELTPHRVLKVVPYAVSAIHRKHR